MSASNDDLPCQELVELVTEYLEDRLSPPERARFEAHLAICSGCRTYLEQMRQTIRAIGHISHEPITSRTRDEVLAIFRAWRRERR